MISGAVYEVLPGDNINSALWLPPEDVLICEAPIMYQGRAVMIYDIINTEEGEKWARVAFAKARALGVLTVFHLP